MESALVGAQINVAGLALSSFSITLDLINTVQAGLSAWERFRSFEDDVNYFKARVVLQHDILSTWRSDWYGFKTSGTSSVWKLRLLQTHDSTIQQTLSLIEAEIQKLSPLRLVEGEQKDASIYERVKWVAGQQRLADVSLTRVTVLLDGLLKILPLQSSHVEAQIMVSLLQNGTTQLMDLANEAEAHGSGMPLLGQSAQLKLLNTKLDDELQLRMANWQESARSTTDLVVARPTDLAIEDGTAGTRSHGSSARGGRVMVEWKPYTSAQGADGILLRGRRDNLIKMLKATPKPAEMLTLPCLGYFDDVEHRRYGFVFESPAVSADEEVVSLNRLLPKTPAELLPTLTDRYQLAHQLSLSLSIFLAIGWLHKGLRSHNVLLVRRRGGGGGGGNDDGEAIRWSRPHVSGFTYSRPQAPAEVSEKLEHSERFNLYRHPLSQDISAAGAAVSRGAYRPAFDIYSLGVILFEIAAWTPAFPLWQRDAEAFRREITKANSRRRIAHWMGRDYCDATMRCLDGSLEGMAEGVERAFFGRVVDVLRRCVPE